MAHTSSSIFHSTRPSMKLLVGLGNPGTKYENTRHNIGFLVLDEIAGRLNLSFREKTSFESRCAETMIGTEKIFLCKPHTFMNASGNAVQKAMKKIGAKPSDLIVVYDDADLAFGDIRWRESGSSGGHNGIGSILLTVPKGASVPRVRVGIGRPPHTDTELESWVLGTWTKKEQDALPEIIRRAADEVFAHLPKP